MREGGGENPLSSHMKTQGRGEREVRIQQRLQQCTGTGTCTLAAKDFSVTVARRISTADADADAAAAVPRAFGGDSDCRRQSTPAAATADAALSLSHSVSQCLFAAADAVLVQRRRVRLFNFSRKSC